MITYQQEPDLSALAETFEERDEINSVKYEPTENHWVQTRFLSEWQMLNPWRDLIKTLRGDSGTSHHADAGTA